MARPPKQGIDYSAWRVDIFENDTKIDALLDAQGWDGFAVYFYLCQKAYSSDGYFYRWSYDNAATTARRMGGGIRSETVRQTVGVCLRVGLFDKRLFELGGVLTSKGIQRQFASVIQNRRCRKVNMEYWILNADETRSYGITLEKNDPQGAEGVLYPSGDSLQDANWELQDANGGLQDANGGYDPYRVKESKVKESKGEDNARARGTPRMTQSEKAALSYKEHERREVLTLIEARKLPPKLEYALRDWVAYKEELGSPYHSAGANALVAGVAAKAGEIGEAAVCDAINESMANNWKSIVYDRVTERAGKKKPRGGSGDYDWDAIREELRDRRRSTERPEGDNDGLP